MDFFIQLKKLIYQDFAFIGTIFFPCFLLPTAGSRLLLASPLGSARRRSTPAGRYVKPGKILFQQFAKSS